VCLTVLFGLLAVAVLSVLPEAGACCVSYGSVWFAGCGCLECPSWGGSLLCVLRFCLVCWLCVLSVLPGAGVCCVSYGSVWFVGCGCLECPS
jgi:hypothetical protein